MGTDYNNGSGFLVSLDQMLSLITEENYKLAIIGLGFARQETEEYSEQDCSLMTVPMDNDYTYKQFIKWFEEFHTVKGEAGKYGGDCEFANGFYQDTVGNIWHHIVDLMKIKLPCFECRIFDSGRQAMECPLGVACFIFDDEQCYNKRLSAMGKRFKDFAGELNLVQWTDVSY